jgi:hypothetical protein
MGSDGGGGSRGAKYGLTYESCRPFRLKGTPGPSSWIGVLFFLMALRSALAGLRGQELHDPPGSAQPVQIFLPLRLDCFQASVWSLPSSSSLATAWLCSRAPSHAHAPRQPRPGQAKSEMRRCVVGSTGPIWAACSRVGGGSAPFASTRAARSAVSTAASLPKMTAWCAGSKEAWSWQDSYPSRAG